MTDRAKLEALERWLDKLREEYPEVYVRHTPVYREWERERAGAATEDTASRPLRASSEQENR